MHYLDNDRVLFCKMLLDVFRVLSNKYGHVGAAGSYADEMFLRLAIVMGQLEGRPMTATKLSDYVGIPRPTVVRKLKDMQERGIIAMDRRRNSVAVKDAVLYSNEAISGFIEARKMVIDAARKMGKDMLQE